VVHLLRIFSLIPFEDRSVKKKTHDESEEAGIELVPIPKKKSSKYNLFPQYLAYCVVCGAFARKNHRSDTLV
jgi:hypothetical protein